MKRLHSAQCTQKKLKPVAIKSSYHCALCLATHRQISNVFIIKCTLLHKQKHIYTQRVVNKACENKKQRRATTTKMNRKKHVKKRRKKKTIFHSAYKRLKVYNRNGCTYLLLTRSYCFFFISSACCCK